MPWEDNISDGFSMAGAQQATLKAGILHPVHLGVGHAHKELIGARPEGDGGHAPGKLGGPNLLELWGSRGLQKGSLSRAQQEIAGREELDAGHPLRKFVLRGPKFSNQGRFNANLFDSKHTK